MTIYRDDLERVYALIERPEAWRKEWYVSYIDDKPCRWCLEGAFIHVKGMDIAEWSANKNCEREEFDAALGLHGGAIASYFNDHHTHAEVLALLRSAIERAPVRP